LRHDVAGADKVDVVATHRLQIQHDIRQFRSGFFLAPALPAGLPILTEHATHVAAREEYRARPAPTAQGVLLAVMRAGAVDNSQLAGAADHAVQRFLAVHMAIASAQVTVFQMFVRNAGAPRQLAGPVQRHPGGFDTAGRRPAGSLADLHSKIKTLAA